MSPEPRIFISYSRRDADAAQSLATLCAKAGAETWLDLWNLRPGDQLAEQLDQAIDRSNIFLVLVSHADQSDSHLRSRELSAICERKWAHGDVRIIPIRLDHSELPAFLSDLQALDGSTSAKLASCVQHIRQHPTVRVASDLNSPTREQLEAQKKRFGEVLEALRKTLASIDAPPMDSETPVPVGPPAKEQTDE